MKIDRNNYEIYFLDYLEGTLPAEETAGLLIFIEENPDLKALIEDEEWLRMVPDKEIKFHPKSALKKKLNAGDESGLADNTSHIAHSALIFPAITSGNYEEFIIRFHDNDLSESEKAALADFLTVHPTFIKEFELFENTRIKPDTGIIYSHKSGLKRNIIAHSGVKKVFAMIAVAASVLLFSTLALKYINQPGSGVVDKQIAQSIHKSMAPEKTPAVIVNPIKIKATEIIRTDNTEQPTKTINSKVETAERTIITVPASLNIRQAALPATAQISIPPTIERRTDFDGVTSTAYYDPDPDAMPIRTAGIFFGRRLKYNLNQGIAQATGIIAEGFEAGRVFGSNVSLSTIADLGLEGYNKITDNKISITRDYNTVGHLKGYYFKNDKK